MSKKAGGGYNDSNRRSISPIIGCFADEEPSWTTISNMKPDSVRYAAIIEKLKGSFSADKKTSKLYVDPVTFRDMFDKLSECIPEIDEAVKNHDYNPDKKDTKNILFVRDIFIKKFNIHKVRDAKKGDQRLILFETAAIILLSMNKKLSNQFFPKYRSIDAFVEKYPHYCDLNYDEKNQYMQFANYIVVGLQFLRGYYNEKHLIPLGLRIVAGRGEEYITGKGKTDKTKRRTEILKTEAENLGESPKCLIQEPWDKDPNIEDPEVFTDWLKDMVGGEHDFDFLENTYDKEYTNPYAPNVVHRVNQKSTVDGSFNIEYHETRLDHGDERPTILSKSVSLIEKWREGDDRFDEEIAGIEFLRLPSFPAGGASVTRNQTKLANDCIIRTTSINVKNAFNPEAAPGQKRTVESNTKYEDDLPQLIRSISQTRHPDEIELMRTASDVGDLYLNHWNMASLTEGLEGIMAISSMDNTLIRCDSMEEHIARNKLSRFIDDNDRKDAEKITKEIHDDYK